MTDTSTSPEPVALGTATAFLPATEESVTTVHAGRHRLTVDAPRLRHAAAASTPLDLLIAALASDMAISVRRFADGAYDFAGDVEVHVHAYEAGPSLRLACRVTYTEDLDPDDAAGVLDLVSRTPIRHLLSGDVTVEAEVVRVPRRTR